MQFSGKYGVTMEKIQQKPTEATDYGNLVHTACEDYLKQNKSISQKFKNEMHGLLHKLNYVLKHRGFHTDYIEQRLSINETGKCDWKDRTIGVIADVLLHPAPCLAIYKDWKTAATTNWAGKYKTPKHIPVQMELTALTMFIQNPGLKVIIGTLEYLRHDQRITYIFKRNEDKYQYVDHTGKVFTVDYKIDKQLTDYWRIQSEGDYYFKPSGLCNGWCDVVMCPEWKPKRRAK
jgi:hypothetical protein